MRAGFIACVLVLAMCAIAEAQLSPSSTSEEQVRGVNPADNITKIELLPKLAVTAAGPGFSLTTLTIKYDRAIRGTYGVNVELPLARSTAPTRSDTGVSDLNLRGRVQFTRGKWTLITGLETVLPIASADSLGAGKWQLNPTGVVVCPFTERVFVALVAKQFLSVAGSADRADVRQGLYRALAAYVSPHGWWTLADPQLSVDFQNAGRVDGTLEGEFGRMVGPRTGAWIRAGGHVAGSWTKTQWSVSTGIRFIRLSP